MHIIKQLFSNLTGYHIHKVSTLPVGTNLFIDIHKRIQYGALKTIFDVGANTGQSWKEYRNAAPKAKIFCFEPVRETFEMLQMKTSGDQNSICEKLAFGNFSGEKVITLYDNASALNSLEDHLMNADSNARNETIKVETIDKYCEENNVGHIDFLKIDTEGYEIHVLEGAKTMLHSAKISLIYAEVGFSRMDERHTSFCELNNWLQNFNYQFFALYQLGAHSWSDGYYGNALFLHKNIYKAQ